MSLASEDTLLTSATVPRFVAERVNLLGPELRAEEISGGNLNFSFRVQDASGKSVFVKQAPSFIKVFGPGEKLHRERMELEVKVYQEWRQLLGAEVYSRYLPEIYHFDVSHMAFIMEFLDDFTLLDGNLNAGIADLGASTAIGRLLGILHARSHSSILPRERSQYLMEAFRNSKLREVQLEYVFSKAFRETEIQELRLKAVEDRIEQLKRKYKGEEENNALLHGDLHPGSVMVSASSVKVIDPEFAIYGPPGHDLGSLLSGFVLASLALAATGNASAAAEVNRGAVAVWSSYALTLAEEGLERELPSISEDAAAFASCEIARTALNCAGHRGFHSLEAAPRSAATAAAISLAARCLAATGGVEELLDMAMNSIQS